MEFYDLFYKRVPVYLRLPILTLLYFVLLTANGIYTGNTTDTSSSLGLYSEPYTMAYYSIYIGMSVGSMTNIRFRERFSGKSLLLGGFFVMLAMNAICATTKNPYLTVICCLMLGMGKVAASTEIYLVWLQVWSKKLDVSRLYPFVYFLALGGLYLMTWLTTRLAYFYNWQYAYIAILMIICFCIVLTVIFVEYHPPKRRLPLYQLDLTGIGLLIAFMMLVNYVVVYGRVEDWTASRNILLATFSSIFLLLAFIRRELRFKRPVFPLDLFKLGNFRLGLLFFFLLGIFAPATIQATFSGGVLHYENYRNAELTLYLIPGITAGAVFCYYWFFRGYHDLSLILIGFICVVFYEIILYNSFSNNFELREFWFPSLIKGFGLGILFVAIGIYITRGHTIKDVLTVVGISFLARSFLGTALFTSVFNYFSYTQRIRHLNYLGGLIDVTQTATGTPTAGKDLYAALQAQATLAAAKELTGYTILAGFAIIGGIVLLILAPGFRRLLRRNT
jgi:DHA2 family multidrug resistance protein